MLSHRHTVGLFAWAAATLLLELTWTRVLSVAQWYHFGFLVISTALLGFGAAGATLSAWRWLRDEAPLDDALATLAGVFAIATLAAFILFQQIPFDPFGVLTDRRQWLYAPLTYLLLASPFYVAGLGFALLFTRGTASIGRLYGADLIGAGSGCLIMPFVMPRLGGGGTTALAASLGFVAAAAFAGHQRRRPSVAALTAALVVATAAPWFASQVPIRITPLKVRPRIAPIVTRWNASSRVEVFELRPPGAASSIRRIVIDGGTAGTGIQDLRPGVRAYLAAHPDDRDYPSGIAYVGRPHPRVLVIGSGGGAEVLDALHYGAAAVTAVEVNPAIVDLVGTAMRDYWGGLFDQPEVRLVLDEGRSFLRRSRERFDAIISIHTISNAAVASGAMALSENYVLTREAFEDYLDHLNPGGTILFSRPEPQLARIVATAREALAARGIVDARRHFYAFRVQPDESEHRMFGGQREAFEADVLIARTPFTEAAIEQVERIASIGVASGGPDGVVRERLYSPFAPSTGSVLSRLATATDLEAIYRAEARELRPATDDRPYFNHLTRWSGLTGGALAQLFEPQRIGGFMLGDRPVAEVTLVALLVQSTAIAVLCLLWPAARAGRLTGHAQAGRTLVYFAALGLGFITIELAAINRLTLFLGQPAYSLTLVLAVLLISSGAGSALEGRFRWVSSTVWIALGVALLGFTFVVPALLRASLGWPFVLRAVVAASVLAPLGLLMGVPFPSGVRALAERSPSLVPWAWSINAFTTVVGTVASLMLAMTVGFTVTLLAGTACYAMAWLTSPARSDGYRTRTRTSSASATCARA